MIYNNPLVLQRADPWVLRYDGEYLFTASHPQYDRIVLRRSATLNGLQTAHECTVWSAHANGPMSKYIWAPEIHRINGAWYIYFAAAEYEFEFSGLPTHRMFVLENDDDDPFSRGWYERGQIRTPLDSFSLDATTRIIGGVQYLVWAQKDPSIEGNSNLYIAAMLNPWTLSTQPVMLSRPEFAWECVDFKVNEGPAFLEHGDVVYLTYSASGTGVPYAIGMLSAKRGSNLLDASAWRKSSVPVFSTCEKHHQYGPGHNSFTVSEDGKRDLIIYHARNYTDIKGDPLFDPNRHTRVGEVRWSNKGPVFGEPDSDNRWTPSSSCLLYPDGTTNKSECRSSVLIDFETH